MSKKVKVIALQFFIAARLFTHDGVFVTVRSPKPKLQPPEVSNVISRVRKRGSKFKGKV